MASKVVLVRRRRSPCEASVACEAEPSNVHTSSDGNGTVTGKRVLLAHTIRPGETIQLTGKPGTATMERRRAGLHTAGSAAATGGLSDDDGSFVDGGDNGADIGSGAEADPVVPFSIAARPRARPVRDAAGNVTDFSQLGKPDVWNETPLGQSSGLPSLARSKSAARVQAYTAELRKQRKLRTMVAKPRDALGKQQEEWETKLARMRIFERTEALRERHALERWEATQRLWDSERRRLSQALHKPMWELVMDRGESYRAAVEEKTLIETAIPMTDKRNTGGVIDTGKRTYNSLPLPIWSKKRPTFERVGRPRSLSTGSAMQQSGHSAAANPSYTVLRKKELQSAIKEVEPHTPQIDDLEVIGHCVDQLDGMYLARHHHRQRRRQRRRSTMDLGSGAQAVSSDEDEDDADGSEDCADDDDDDDDDESNDDTDEDGGSSDDGDEDRDDDHCDEFVSVAEDDAVGDDGAHSGITRSDGVRVDSYDVREVEGQSRRQQRRHRRRQRRRSSTESGGMPAGEASAVAAAMAGACLDVDADRLVFESDVRQACKATLHVYNSGSTVVFYKWQALAPRSALGVQATTAAQQRFYLHDVRGSILPGERHDFSFMFKSSDAGIFSQSWVMHSEPAAFHNGSEPGYMVALKGIAVRPDVHAAARSQLQQRLERQAVVSAIHAMLHGLVDQVQTPRAASPATTPLLADEQAFIAANKDPALFYHPNVLARLRALAQQVGCASWDQSVASLHAAIRHADLPVSQRDQALVQLSQLVQRASVPRSTEDVAGTRPYDTAYFALSECVTALARVVEETRAQHGMPALAHAYPVFPDDGDAHGDDAAGGSGSNDKKKRSGGKSGSGGGSGAGGSGTGTAGNGGGGGKRGKSGGGSGGDGKSGSGARAASAMSGRASTGTEHSHGEDGDEDAAGKDGSENSGYRAAVTAAASDVLAAGLAQAVAMLDQAAGITALTLRQSRRAQAAEAETERAAEQRRREAETAEREAQLRAQREIEKKAQEAEEKRKAADAGVAKRRVKRGRGIGDGTSTRASAS